MGSRGRGGRGGRPGRRARRRSGRRHALGAPTGRGRRRVPARGGGLAAAAPQPQPGGRSVPAGQCRLRPAGGAGQPALRPCAAGRHRGLRDGGRRTGGGPLGGGARRTPRAALGRPQLRRVLHHPGPAHQPAPDERRGRPRHPAPAGRRCHQFGRVRGQVGEPVLPRRPVRRCGHCRTGPGRRPRLQRPQVGVDLRPAGGDPRRPGRRQPGARRGRRERGPVLGLPRRSRRQLRHQHRLRLRRHRGR